MAEIMGASTYSTAPTRLAVWPSLFFTVAAANTDAPAGTVNETDVAAVSFTSAAATPPMVIVIPSTKPVPAGDAVVPPCVATFKGVVIAVSVGAY